MALLNFNSAGHETQTSFEPIPNDWYNVTMQESEMKPTKNNDGAYLECQLKVVDGDFAGRLVWLRLNLDNKNEVAQEIAYKQLASICEATGVINVGDSAELHGKPFMVKVVVRPPQGDYDASNEIKGFKACAGGGAASSGGPSGGGKPAWANKDKKAATKKEEPAVKEPEAKKEPEPKQEVAADTTVEETPAETGETSAKPPWMQ